MAPETGSDALSASSAATYALRYVGELITSEPTSVTSVEPADDDGWLVEVEVLEERRIPSSADMLALYEVELDPDGALLAYRRTKRYARGRAGTGNGVS
ncbi:gas vesicle protein GvpO [Amycolatopsis sp. SID8362]|uniref:gas vesicle protein GvpO n=1 Tax=Amycolatopsis sp. SID8362 TaxID=2690346 RepID=UPI001369A2C8|nr:gas vesicle protein GvpO [Amycolatopsis sp. SID8362]NBH01749.1 gas vesicle protein [Amycolatopsis sp. SID8362]NED38450.1 gas vesicle protein [Amycolatopsis sp. SID8362]